MSRHLADHRARSDGSRLTAFYRIEKSGGEEAGLHPASRDLHKRTLTREDGTRTENFVRIDRGITV